MLRHICDCFTPMIYSYSAAITVLCISLLLSYIHHYKEHHPNYLPADLNNNMPGNDQSQVDSLLTAWVKMHLGSIYHDQSAIAEQNDFRTAFNSTFSENVSIYINHERISRDDFESEMRASRSAFSRSSAIDWKEMLQIPKRSNEGATSAPCGIVAGFFIVTRSVKLKIRASDAKSLSYNSFSARISQEGGQTRITELFLTFCNQVAPIYLRGIPTQF